MTPRGLHARTRPLVLVAAGLASLALISSSAVASSAPSVSATQDVVALGGPEVAHAKPSGTSKSLGVVPARTPITGEHTTLPLLGTYGSWLLVRLPGRPNGHTGWISEKGTTPSVTAWHLVIDTAARRVTVYHADRVVRVIKAVVGKPSTPTPPGEYFVEESIKLDAGAVGAPYALALSARSNVFQEFEGGPGQIALHGLRNVGGVPGTAVSHGCVRLDDAAIRWLAGRIGPGVPVTIVA